MDAKQLITELLQVQASKRLSAHAVLDHPWLQKTAPHQKLEATALKHISALETFHNQNFLRHLAAGVLAKQLDESDLHELHRAFCEMDQDENGVVTFSEFKDVLRHSVLAVTFCDVFWVTFVEPTNVGPIFFKEKVFCNILGRGEAARRKQDILL